MAVCERILPLSRAEKNAISSTSICGIKDGSVGLEMELFRCSNGDRIGEFLPLGKPGHE
jgi:hypothetical protein